MAQQRQQEIPQQWTNQEANEAIKNSGTIDGDWARRNDEWHANHGFLRPEAMNPQHLREFRQLVGDYRRTSNSRYMAALMCRLWDRPDPTIFDEFYDQPAEARAELERIAQPYWDLAGRPWAVTQEILDDVWAWNDNFPPPRAAVPAPARAPAGPVVARPPPVPLPVAPVVAPLVALAPVPVAAGGRPHHNNVKTITGRDPNWLFICDVCGHAVLYQGEFNRHVRDGRAGAAGFGVVASNPVAGETRWYGEDDAGNRYEGDTVRVGTAGVNRGGAIPEPCGGNIRAKKAANRR
ncbi:hypothetical protein PV05_03553 [Exophiala xenobiotica]|uniref:Uncharacterized protein n=1 Tax=Exophiala xenobiotica TaxID=348802 RepID=A0A0D2C2P4_9EURO|nr:uncharacterized protein PV05_03553 [Exophiala xenobiotica]KIW59076.1 hypothetical protein PV05_03553 [Exophiala xenobiotica]